MLRGAYDKTYDKKQGTNLHFELTTCKQINGAVLNAVWEQIGS